MIKKIWLLLLSLFVTFWFWVSLANPIAIERAYVCTMFENVEIDNYRVVVQNGSGFYMPIVNTCSECWWRKHGSNTQQWLWLDLWFDFSPQQKVFLLNKTIQLDNITEEIIESKAILIWYISTIYCDESYNKTQIYQVIHSWSNYALLDITEQYKIKEEQDKIMKNYIKEFPNYWILAVIVETIILFLIAKFCRKFWFFKNRKLLLTWVLASTLTLPLLRFVLPIFFSNYRVYVIFWEILVTIIEVFIIKYSLKIDRKMAIFASIVCNLCSFIIWLFIF
jgi:hypothetical protein